MSFNLSTRINNLQKQVNQLIAGTVTNPMTTALNLGGFAINNASALSLTSTGTDASPFAVGATVPYNTLSTTSGIISITWSATTGFYSECILSPTIPNLSIDAKVFLQVRSTNFPSSGIATPFTSVIYDAGLTQYRLIVSTSVAIPLPVVGNTVVFSYLLIP